MVADGGPPLEEFADIIRRLRAECPWKAAQTHRSLARYLLEESHEVLEALDTGDVDHLCDELGDLLLQVFLHAAIAEEAGEFTLDDVASGATAKMVRRNPHVFEADGPSLLTPAEVNVEWDRRKKLEKAKVAPSVTSVLDALPPGLPALLLATKVLERAEREPDSPSQSLRDQACDTVSEHDMGERLLALVDEARHSGIDAEQALRGAVRRRVGAHHSDPSAPL